MGLVHESAYQHDHVPGHLQVGICNVPQVLVRFIQGNKKDVVQPLSPKAWVCKVGPCQGAAREANVPAINKRR